MVSSIILCGGASFRLNPGTSVPKPLIDLGGMTLLDYQIKWLRKYQVEDIVLATNQFVTTSLPVRYSIEEENLGTGGALKKALDLVKDEIVLVINVDDLLHYDVRELVNDTRTSDKNYIVLSKAVLPFGLVKLEQSRIIGFEEKPVLRDMFVSAGHYCFHKDVLSKFLPSIGDFEDSLNKIAENIQIYAFFVDDWITISTYRDYLETREIFLNWKKKTGII